MPQEAIPIFLFDAAILVAVLPYYIIKWIKRDK